MHTTPNPWAFGNTDRQTISPDNFHRLVYYNLNEVAMGAPLDGECYLETKGGQKIKIHDSCGGPPVWETTGQLVALPIWTERRNQQIAVVNVITKELTIFQEQFGVLRLQSFEKNMISSEGLSKNFDIQKERVVTLIKLVE